MLNEHLGRIVAIAAYLPIDSLNQPVAANDGDDFLEDLIDTVADPRFSGEDDIVDELNRRLVRQFVQQLPERLKLIVVRYYWMGDQQDEIANDLGVTQSAISHAIRKVHRLARQALA